MEGDSRGTEDKCEGSGGGGGGVRLDVLEVEENEVGRCESRERKKTSEGGCGEEAASSIIEGQKKRTKSNTISPASTKGPDDKSKISKNKGRKKSEEKLQKTPHFPETLATGKEPMKFFSHLPTYKQHDSMTERILFAQGEIHPAVVRLGLQFAQRRIVGNNCRTVAMLTAFKKFIQDYRPPPLKNAKQHLENQLKKQISFITSCRPHSVGMGNAIKYVKLQVEKVGTSVDLNEMVLTLCGKIDAFINERIVMASLAIAERGVEVICDHDNILVYGPSTSTLHMMTVARRQGRVFRVVVIDSRPNLHSRGFGQSLSKEGIEVTYSLFNGLSYHIAKASKVFLGAWALLSNGSLVNRAGSSAVAMMAKGHVRPVVVCCESYKFTDKVQLDAICNNELANPDDLIRTVPPIFSSPLLMDWRTRPHLKVLNLNYDVTPREYISMVITERGKIPPSAVAAMVQQRASEMDGDC